MDHLDVVTGASLTDPVAAGLAIDLGSNGLEDGLEVRPEEEEGGVNFFSLGISHPSSLKHIVLTDA